jgi:LPS sulfotransferase NodH
VIAESPRSGSQLLADLLWRTGRMGAPGEYLNLRSTMPFLADRLGCGPIARPGGVRDYLRAVILHRTTPNGVFGLKAHFGQLRPFLADRSVRDLLRASRFAWLRRRDLAAQAVSLAVALRTRQWRRMRGDAPPPLDLPYSSQDIDRAAALIAGEERGWQMAFERNGIEPLRVWYEDLVADPDPICRGICRLVGIDDAGPFRLADSALARQDDPLKDRWRRRYMAGLDWTAGSTGEAARPAGRPPAPALSPRR